MPSRNVLKQLVPQSFYHVYARGASRQPIFCDDADYTYFLHLFERYLSESVVLSKTGAVYPHYRGRIKLVAYCLMSNHFHLLLWQDDESAMTDFMRSVMTSYSRYFNLKYRRSGALFESRYKASLISEDSYLDHISRYIHLNPRYWQKYKYSSLAGYFVDRPEWLQPEQIEILFASRNAYINFLRDYQEQKDMLEEIKHSLADS
jgi:REP element-mobilizing transposase RayT